MAKDKETTKPAAPAEPTEDSKIIYTFGKPYRVRVEHNKRTWGRIEPMLMKGATFKQLVDACKYEDKGSEVDHHGFIKYLIRNGNIAEAKKQ